jgi:hypothetical protein
MTPVNPPWPRYCTSLDWRSWFLNADISDRRAAILNHPESCLRHLGGRHSTITETLESLQLLQENVFLDTKNLSFSIAAIERNSIRLESSVVRAIITNKDSALTPLRTACFRHRQDECYSILHPNYMDDIVAKLNLAQLSTSSAPSTTHHQTHIR